MRSGPLWIWSITLCASSNKCIPLVYASGVQNNPIPCTSSAFVALISSLDLRASWDNCYIIFHMFIHADGLEPGHVCVGHPLYHPILVLSVLYEDLILKFIMIIWQAGWHLRRMLEDRAFRIMVSESACREPKFKLVYPFLFGLRNIFY